MRKRIQTKKFGREKAQRTALLNSLANSLFLNGRIKTTEAKCKELKKFAEKLITKAKKGDLHNTRILSKSLNKKTVKKIIDEIAPKYKSRRGGYVRIIKIQERKSDGARMGIIELI